MAIMVVRRLFQFLLTVVGASFIAFLAMYVFADPVDTILPLGASDEVRSALRAEMGLDRPVLVQYLAFAGDAIRGDFGVSTWLGTPALQTAIERLPATALIVLPATLIGVLLGSLAGLTAGRKPGTVLDRFISTMTYGAVSAPEFWIGIVAIYVFSVQLGWFPSGGYAVDLSSMALPVAVLAVRPFAHSAQVMRSGAIEESVKQYVTTARSKGLTEVTISFRHVLRNAALPVLTVAIYDLGRLFIGISVAIEVVFAWPGIGRLAVGALERGDIFLVQAIVLVGAVVVAFLSLAADMLYHTLDPRTRAAIRGART